MRCRHRPIGVAGADRKARPFGEPLRLIRRSTELADRGAHTMNAFDVSPLLRAAIGFDRMARLVETARAASEGPAYPPYNIEKTAEDSYVLTMAVAGFGPNDIELTVH